MSRSVLLKCPEGLLLDADRLAQGRGKAVKVDRQALLCILMDYDKLVAVAKESGVQLVWPDKFQKGD